MEKVQERKQPTEAEMKKLQEEFIAYQEKKKKCWEELLPVLKKYNFRFSAQMSMNDLAQVKFSIELIDGEQEKA